MSAISSERRRRRPFVLFAALACAGVIAGCGASGGANGTGTSALSAKGAASQGLAFARCMRANGVPNFPDPTEGGGGIQIGGSGIDPNAPGFRTAQGKCSKYLPKGGPGTSAPTAAQKASALRLAKCIRGHGDPSFPDPTYGTPTGNEQVLAIRGAMFKVGPGFDPRSPAFQTALSACGVRPPPKQGVRQRPAKQ